MAEEWNDPRTWIALGSLAVGVCGFLFGILSNYWNRRESRLDALSKVLHPLVLAAQHLQEANDCRRRCEQLKRSFPDSEKAREAAARINDLIGQYGKLIEAAHDDFRTAEAELASRTFRFPDKVARLVKGAYQSLSEFGRLVNEGFFSKADVHFAKFQDDYKQIVVEGRGWRLADPFEGIWKRIRRNEKDAMRPHEWELSEKEMKAIMELVEKRATSQSHNAFAVHPPKKLIDRPQLAKADNVIDELRESVFVVTFQDGTSRMMPLVELMVFTYNLIVLAYQHHEVARMLGAIEANGTQEVTVSFRFSVEEIMRPEMVKALLEKIDFSPDPCDVNDADGIDELGQRELDHSADAPGAVFEDSDQVR